MTEVIDEQKTQAELEADKAAREDESRKTLTEGLAADLVEEMKEKGEAVVDDEQPPVETPETPPAPEVVDDTKEEAPPELPPKDEDKYEDVPEYYKEMDAKDELILDAINHFEGGETSDWLRQNQKDMDDNQREALRSVQKAYETHRNDELKKDTPAESAAPSDHRAEASAKLAWLEQNNPQAYKYLDSIANNIPLEQKKKKEEPTYELNKELMSKLKQAQEDADDATVTETLLEIVKDSTDRSVAKVLSDVDNRIKQQFDTYREQAQEDDNVARIKRQTRELVEEDRRVLKYLKADQFSSDGAPVSCLLGRIVDMGKDPITGQDVSTPAKAYDYILQRESGGTRRIGPRPSDGSQPPAGSGIGEVPSHTEAYMDAPLEQCLWEDAQGTLIKK